MGHVLPLASVPSLPLAAGDLVLGLVGKRRVRPWISYRAARELGRIIRNDWHILELGSGMSAIWFAQRCGRAVSIESDVEWSVRVAAMILQRGIRNVDLRFRPEPGGYLADVEGLFNLVLIDGPGVIGAWT